MAAQSLPAGNGPPGAAAEAIKALVLLHQLTVEAVQSRTRSEFFFRLVNSSAGLCRYDRAVLASPGAGAVLAVSGISELPKRAELPGRWARLANALKNPESAGVLGRESFDGEALTDWDGLVKTVPGLMVLWLPLFCRGRLVGGLWLERFGGTPWRESEARLLVSLAKGYGAAWEKFVRSKGLVERARGLFGKKRTLALAGAIVAVLVLVRPPLRIVAPCEVVPKDPFVVTAPLNGVIADAPVTPGQEVAAGDVLFAYDKRVPLEERDVARQQVEIIRSSLERARVQAFMDPQARAEASLLKLRLAQEEIRLRLAEENVAKLEVRAERPGRVVIDDPNAWRGRPVEIGQKVLMLVDPEKTRLRIWLPEDDNVLFDRARPVRAVLNAAPEKSLEAKLAYVADEVSLSPRREPRVEAEADWIEPPLGSKMGMQGAASLYGEKVSLAYWLARKPLFWLRRALGI